MRWSRGLLRLWIAATGVWTIFVIAMMVSAWPPPVRENFFDQFDDPRCPGVNTKAPIDLTKLTDEQLACLTGGPVSKTVQRQRKVDELMKQSAIVGALPPAVVFILGALGVWIARGFRPR